MIDFVLGFVCPTLFFALAILAVIGLVRCYLVSRRERYRRPRVRRQQLLNQRKKSEQEKG